MSEDIYWYNKKPLEWGDPGKDFRRREKEKLSNAVNLINESGQFNGKDHEEILKNYGFLMRGHTIYINSVSYSNLGSGDKSPMGYIKDCGAKDVLEASTVLDEALELIK